MKKYLCIVGSLVLAVSLLMVPAAPAAAAVGEGTFTVTGGTYETVAHTPASGDIVASLTGAWIAEAVTGDFSATGTFNITSEPQSTGTISVIGTLSANEVTFGGDVLMSGVGLDVVTSDTVIITEGTIVIDGNTFDADLTGNIGGYPVTINISGDIYEASTFTITSGTYQTVMIDENTGVVSAILVGSWGDPALIGEFTATGIGKHYVQEMYPNWGTTADVSLSGTMSADGITFVGTALRTDGDDISSELISLDAGGTIVIQSDGSFVAALTGVVVGGLNAGAPVDIDMTGSIFIPGTTVGLLGEINEVPVITAISVTPTEINFGNLYLGQTSPVTTITVSNAGGVDVGITASVDGEFFPLNLWLDEEVATAYTAFIAVGGSVTPGAKVIVPVEYPVGSVTGTLIFTATATATP